MAKFKVTLDDGSDVVVQADSPEEAAKLAESGNVLDPIGKGLMMSFSDEAAGLLGAIPASIELDIPLGEAYEGVRDIARRRQKGFAARNPIASPIIETAAALPTAVAGGVRALGAAPTMLRTVGVGTGEGALAAFGAGEGDPVEQALSAIPGGILGGALGAGGQTLSNMIPPLFPGKLLPQQAIQKGVDADLMTAPMMRARARQGGPLATPVDIGGEGMVSLAQQVAGATPATRAIAQRGLQRGKGQTGRVLDAVEEATGTRPNWGLAGDEIEEIGALRSEMARPLFDKVRQYEVPMTETLDNALDQDIVKSAWRRAQSAARLEGRDLPNIYTADDAGNITPSGVAPDMDAWMEIKEYMDDAIKGSKRYVNELTGKPTKLGNKMFAFKDKLVSELDRITEGDYKKARDAWAGKSAVMDAVDEGRSFLKANTSDVRKSLKRMSDSEKEGYLVGVSEAIRERMGRSGEGQMREFNFMEEGNFQEKLAALLPGGKNAVRRFMNRLKRERRFKEVETKTIGGSQTRLRETVEGAFERNLPLLSDIQESGVVGGTMQSGTRWLQNQVGGVPDSVKEEVARLIFKQGGTEELLRYLSSSGVNAPVMQSLMQGLRVGPMALGAGSMSAYGGNQ